MTYLNEGKNYTIIDAGESMMLAIFLILALTIVILTGYNMVTCLVEYKDNGQDWITYTLAVYPVYQLIYTGYIKGRLDSSSSKSE